MDILKHLMTTNLSKAVYYKKVFDVVDDSKPIFTLRTKILSHKKLVDANFVVDSKRCYQDLYNDEVMWIIIGENSVKPL